MTVIAFAFAKHVISTMKSIQNAENTKIVVESAKIWRRKKNRDASLEFQGFYVNHTSSLLFCWEVAGRMNALYAAGED